MQGESNIHHFVPRSVLRRFAVDPERTSIMVFDKRSGRARRCGFKSTGSLKGYNKLTQPDGTSLNFESDFDDVDNLYAKIANKLSEHRNVAQLDQTFRAQLASVAVIQFLRTPIVRSTLHTLSRSLVAELCVKGFTAISETELPGDDSVRQTTRDLMAECAPLAHALMIKDLILFEPDGEARFWTSDHPMVRISRLPLGEIGFNSLGVEIYLPIASDLLLGFLCPSLRSASVECLSREGDVTTRSIIIEDVIQAGIPLKISNAVVNFFNCHQVESSQRFLYASKDDFDLARKILEHRPAMASNNTFVQIGEMGHAPPRPSNLPPGEWLYLERDTGFLMIPIRDYRNVRSNHEMSTERSDLLNEAISLGRFDRAEIYANGRGGGMRDAKVEVIDATFPPRFRVVFFSADLRALNEVAGGRT